MLKRSLSLTLCILLLSSCANAPSEAQVIEQATAAQESSTQQTEVQPSSAQQTGERIEVESNATFEQSIEEQQNAASSDASIDEADQASLYDLFLSNEATVHIDSENNLGYFLSNIEPSGMDATLEDLVQLMIDSLDEDYGYSGTTIESIEYAFIDCGNDGNKELALCVTTLSIDYYTNYIILKEFDGQLKPVYAKVDGARSQTFINEYGYIMSDGSSGASYHDFVKEYIDGNGKYHYIYTSMSATIIIFDEYGGDLYFNNEFHNLSEELLGTLEGNFDFFQIDLYGTLEDDSDDVYSYARSLEYDNSGDGFRGYFYCNLDDDESIYDDSFPLMQYFNEQSLQIYSKKEIDTMIETKEIQEGLTQEIKNEKVVTWTLLD